MLSFIAAHYPPKPGADNSEYLIKWQGLPYCDCTHEDGDLVMKWFPEAVEEYKKRQKSSFSPSSKPSKVLCFVYLKQIWSAYLCLYSCIFG